MAINIDDMDDAEIAAWFENAEPEDFDSVVDGEALVALARAKALEVRARESMRGAVDLARENGLSWQEIGRVLGMSRQAVNERFAHR
ncbi:hypothetical protein CHIBA101_1782 [Actinomyces sp. Chiba101]|uniref:hypothetical protein n=1 Tax=Actinomyces TaxID=1654 RepID=UPI000974DC1B|nr:MULTISPECIES: hypothetical protein [Actinomyces]BAW93617.1 hypothetical protein CHIBA101_1782 [Actinomyces sp. Chiba101]GAV93535.1 hypothetical protein ADENT20671_0281 [Actinomyces denticolens]SUU74573.1 Uncharacterised protein [Actinomyces denticolens]